VHTVTVVHQPKGSKTMGMHLPGIAVILAQAGIPSWNVEELEPGIRLSQHGDDVLVEAVGYRPIMGHVMVTRAGQILVEAGLTVSPTDVIGQLIASRP
jgi:hypothetical protein